MTARGESSIGRFPGGTGPEQAAPLKLNLGCSDRKIPGFLGVDLADGPGVDLVADLRESWPWENGSVQAVIAHDVIEHLPDAIHTMNELCRVLAVGGTADIVVPTTDGPGAFQDPTHRSFWNRRSFLYYEAGNIYCERFHGKYQDFQGNPKLARFKIVNEHTERTVDGPKLRIVLEKV
jgi:predicted SAM-dependent methyltransferase